MATAPSIHLREQAAYRALASHHEQIGTAHLRDLFASDADRGTRRRDLVSAFVALGESGALA